MPIPQYFQPDSQIPDADLLGYGDLVFDDGSRRFINGDPEIASQFPTQQIETAPPQSPIQPVTIEGSQGRVQLDMSDPQAPIKPLPSDPLDYRSSQPEPTGDSSGFDLSLNAGTPPTFDPNADPLAPQQPMQSAPAAPEQQQSPIQPVTVQGSRGPVQIDMTDPQNPIKPVEQAGMQPYQREGALPPDMAARQQGDMAAMQQQTLAATQQERSETGRLMNEATLKAMAKNEADRIQQEQDVQEQQAKVERWQQEQQDANDMKIDQSLSGAVGLGGGLLAILGSALMSSTGSDAGGRMIDNIIERNVREQVRQKGTTLNLLADKIGSSQQAIKMGKAKLYELAANKADLLVQKTKNDVYEAQSPAIIQGLRQKQMTEMQEAEKLSIGKLTERMPAPPKPTSPEALQKYGELRRDRDAASDVVQRMEQQIGLVWSPGKNGQPGSYINKDEKIKAGIEGVGAIEHLVPDVVYSTMGLKDGYQVRGAKQALAYAAIRQMQPTGLISDMDRKVGELASTMDTEEGLVHTLERLRNGEQQAQMNDSAQYTPQVVAEYERQYRASGGQEQGTPGAARPAGLGDLQGEQQRRRQPQQAPQERGPGNMAPPTPEEFQGSIRGFAESAGLNPEAVARVIQHESGGKPGATNPQTGKHAGLIQFSRETWEGLAKEAGTPDLSWEEMRNMSAEEQLPYVMMYYNRLGLGPDNDAGDYAMATFMPAFWNKPDSFVLGAKGSREKIGELSMAKVYSQNPGLQNGDTITVGDVRRSVL